MSLDFESLTPKIKAFLITKVAIGLRMGLVWLAAAVFHGQVGVTNRLSQYVGSAAIVIVTVGWNYAEKKNLFKQFASIIDIALAMHPSATTEQLKEEVVASSSGTTAMAIVENKLNTPAV